MITHHELRERQMRRGVIAGSGDVQAELYRRDLMDLCVATSDEAELDRIARAYRLDRRSLDSALWRVRRLRALGLPDVPSVPLWLGPLGLRAIEVYRIRDEDLPDDLKGRGLRHET